jgi:hypothetical protein
LNPRPLPLNDRVNDVQPGFYAIVICPVFNDHNICNRSF